MADRYYPDEAPVREKTTRRYYREERRDDRDPRYADPYLNVHSRDLVPRPREDSDYSVEEIQRDFPPPGYHRGGDIRRARSAEPYGDYYDDDRRSTYSRGDRDRNRDRDRDRDRHSTKKLGSVYYEEEEKKRARMLSKQEQIIAAVTGAALAIGGKELYDRRGAKQDGHGVQRNLLVSAAMGAAGAAAGYHGTEAFNKHQQKQEKSSTLQIHKGRDGQVSEHYYSDEDDDPREKKGNKNFLENALAAAGLGGAVKALTGKDKDRDDRSDTRSRRSSRSRSRSKSRGGGGNKVQKAAMASLIAGATEAFRVSKEPGGWKGEKAKRILTAAVGAGAIDSAQNPDKAGSKLGLFESVVGGLVGNRVIHGSRKNIEEDNVTGRSRSRSRARSTGGGGGGGGTSGLAALATAGFGALAGKKILDNRDQSRDRSRSRSRRRSIDSYDDRRSSPDRRRRSRSRSVVDKGRKALAKLGIGSGADDGGRDRSRSRDRRGHDDDDYDDGHGSRRHRRHGSDDDEYERGGRDRDLDDRSRGGRDRSRQRGGGRGKGRTSSRGSVSSSDLGDTDEDEKQAKKMKGKQILTAGLAAVATIHAAHNVYQSMEKRNARHRAVREGRLTEEEAKKLKSKALLQDAASVSIAALGIKGAISEMKEAHEISHECHEWREKKQERHERRMERQKRLQNGDRDPRDRRDRGTGYDNGAPYGEDRYNNGPYYLDGNPYQRALPAPPIGYNDRR